MNDTQLDKYRCIIKVIRFNVKFIAHLLNLDKGKPDENQRRKAIGATDTCCHA